MANQEAKIPNEEKITDKIRVIGVTYEGWIEFDKKKGLIRLKRALKKKIDEKSTTKKELERDE